MRCLFIGGFQDGTQREVGNPLPPRIIFHPGYEEYVPHTFVTHDGEVTVFVGPGVTDPFERLVAGYRPGDAISIKATHVETLDAESRQKLISHVRDTPPPAMVTVVIPPRQPR